jgi:hypothetical protein
LSDVCKLTILGTWRLLPSGAFSEMAQRSLSHNTSRLLDLGQGLLQTHGLYEIFVNGFGDFLTPVDPPWTLKSTIFFAAFIYAIVEVPVEFDSTASRISRIN